MNHAADLVPAASAKFTSQIERRANIANITNVDGFFKAVEDCKGRVELVSPEGDRINLKSKLAQYLTLANIFSDGYIKEMELVAYEESDVSRLIKFMYQGE